MMRSPALYAFVGGVMVSVGLATFVAALLPSALPNVARWGRIADVVELHALDSQRDVQSNVVNDIAKRLAALERAFQEHIADEHARQSGLPDEESPDARQNP